jgi:hypothetical protein
MLADIGISRAIDLRLSSIIEWDFCPRSLHWNQSVNIMIVFTYRRMRSGPLSVLVWLMCLRLANSHAWGLHTFRLSVQFITCDVMSER